jgi:hypothetical protein
VRRILLLLLLAVACATHHAHPSLYERVGARLKKDPHALDGAPSPQGDREKLARFVGKWRCDSHVFATPTTPEREGSRPDHMHFDVDKDGDLLSVDDTSSTPFRSIFIGWDGNAHTWVSATMDSTAFGVLTAPSWSGDRLILEGHVTIVGEPTWLRQTYELVDQDHYVLLNEELGLAKDPVKLDIYHCVRE